MSYGRMKNVSSEFTKGNMPKKRDRLPDIMRLERDVLQSIIGQDKQVRKIITAIYRARSFKSIKTNLLIIGGSGTGKTATIKEVAKRLHIPYTIEDATKYTQEGYYGEDVENMIYNLYENARFNLEKAQKGIIIIDEIDKKINDTEVSGTSVLKSMLKIIEGSIIQLEKYEQGMGYEVVNFDTSDLIVVFLGAFEGLDAIRKKRLNVNQLGFRKSENIQNKLQSEIHKSDLIEYGMPEEFIGRIDSIVEMNKLTKSDLALILKKSKLSIFRKYQRALREKGITLTYSGKLFELIAEKSMSLDTGARELDNTVNIIFEDIIFNVLANPGKFQQCKLFDDIVEDNTRYILS